MKKIGLTLVFIACGLGVVQAQDSTKKIFSWFNFEAGVGLHAEYDAPAVVKIGWQTQINRHLVTLHIGVLGEGLSNYSEIGILYGRVLTPLDSKFMAAASLGYTYVFDSQAQFSLFGGRSGSVSTFQGIGIPIQLNAQYRIFKHLSIGSTVFANVNDGPNFGGITFGIQIGKFWQ